ADPGQFAAQGKGGLVVAQEAGDHQDRLAVERPSRSALAERPDHPTDVPGDLTQVARRRRGVAFPCPARGTRLPSAPAAPLGAAPDRLRSGGSPTAAPGSAGSPA